MNQDFSGKTATYTRDLYITKTQTVTTNYLLAGQYDTVTKTLIDIGDVVTTVRFATPVSGAAGVVTITEKTTYAAKVDEAFAYSSTVAGNTRTQVSYDWTKAATSTYAGKTDTTTYTGTWYSYSGATTTVDTQTLKYYIILTDKTVADFDVSVNATPSNTTALNNVKVDLNYTRYPYLSTSGEKVNLSATTYITNGVYTLTNN
jgi:hypothetical protein